MKNLQPNTLPLVPPPASAEDHEQVGEIADKVVKPAVDPSEITSAAKDGRVMIRPENIGPSILQAIAKKFDAEFIIKGLLECAQATKIVVVGGKPMEVADSKIRLDTIKLLLQYEVGMPVARSEVITHNVDTMQTLEAKIQTSPALRRAIGRMIDKAKSPDGKLVDVTPQRELNEVEMRDAEEALQKTPPSPENPMATEIRKRTMGELLKSRGAITSPEEKFSR
jgi:hypothetical protein